MILDGGRLQKVGTFNDGKKPVFNILEIKNGSEIEFVAGPNIIAKLITRENSKLINPENMSAIVWENEVTPSEPLDPSRGDLNGDDRINAGDLLVLRRYILKLINDIPAPNGIEAADLNFDGKVNAGDYTLLRRSILNDTIPSDK